MKTATQIIQQLLDSPDLNLDSLDPLTVTAILEARAFLVMEEEIHEARALVKVNETQQCRARLDALFGKYGGMSDSLRAAYAYLDRVEEALGIADVQKLTRLKELAREAAALASEDDDDFFRDNRGPNRITEIMKAVNSL